MSISSLPSLGPKESATVIRRILRASFPATKFTVRIGRGAGVSSVHIRWTDGPTSQRVEELVNGFEAGHFDGMQDMYVYDRNSAILVEGVAYQPGTRYVSCQRESSPRSVLRAAQAVAGYWWMEDADKMVLMTAVDAFAADCSDAGEHAFWMNLELGRIYPGHGNRDFFQLVRVALQDRTTVTHQLS